MEDLYENDFIRAWRNAKPYAILKKRCQEDAYGRKINRPSINEEPKGKN